jgi:hypothetical protein
MFYLVDVLLFALVVVAVAVVVHWIVVVVVVLLVAVVVAVLLVVVVVFVVVGVDVAFVDLFVFWISFGVLKHKESMVFDLESYLL